MIRLGVLQCGYETGGDINFVNITVMGVNSDTGQMLEKPCGNMPVPMVIFGAGRILGCFHLLEGFKHGSAIL